MMNEPGPGAIASRFSEGPVETEADALVRELAESDPHVSDDEGNYCFFCNISTPEGKLEIMQHDATCLWLRARKLAGVG